MLFIRMKYPQRAAATTTTDKKLASQYNSGWKTDITTLIFIAFVATAFLIFTGEQKKMRTKNSETMDHWTVMRPLMVL